MKSSFVCVSALFLVLSALPATAEEVAGEWVGRLASGFKMILQIEKKNDGYSGRMRTPNGNMTDLDQVASDGRHVHFSAASVGLSYDGDWDEAKKAWVGALILGQSYPLDFRRAEPADLAPPVIRRPQEEAITANPLPYSQRDVVFENTATGVSLAGTYSLPDGNGPFPAVVLVAGTGRQTRDEDVFGHKVFLVLADALNRQGIAVLRYDKRGSGASTGDYGSATTVDFAADAETALNWLASQSEVDKQRIGMIGHSEGGVIVPAVAVRNDKVAFLVTIAGPGIPGNRLFVLQSALVSAAQGVPEDYIARRRLLMKSFMRLPMQRKVLKTLGGGSKRLLPKA